MTDEADNLNIRPSSRYEIDAEREVMETVERYERAASKAGMATVIAALLLALAAFNPWEIVANARIDYREACAGGAECEGEKQ